MSLHLMLGYLPNVHQGLCAMDTFEIMSSGQHGGGDKKGFRFKDNNHKSVQTSNINSAGVRSFSFYSVENAD